METYATESFKMKWKTETYNIKSLLPSSLREGEKSWVPWPLLHPTHSLEWAGEVQGLPSNGLDCTSGV